MTYLVLLRNDTLKQLSSGYGPLVMARPERRYPI
jgi:hypothetical protein